MKISAFAPPPLRDHYEPRLREAEASLRSGIEELGKRKVSDEVLDDLLKNAREIYTMLYDVHRTVVSGFIVTY